MQSRHLISTKKRAIGLGIFLPTNTHMGSLPNAVNPPDLGDLVDHKFHCCFTDIGIITSMA